MTTELDQVRAAVVADAELRSAGRYVYVARAEGSMSSIDATRCVALGHNPAALTAGGYKLDGPVAIAKAPGELFEARMTIGGMLTLLAPHNSPSPGDVYVAQAAASRIGLADGGMVLLGHGLGRARVSVVDMSARIPDPGPWMWIPTAPVEKLHECWVEVIPAADRVAQQWITAWLSRGEGTVIVARLLGEDRLRTDPVAAFHGRPTRYAWAAAGSVVGIMIWLITWFRRSEMALYRTVGSSRGQTTLLYVIPSMVLVGVGVLLGALYGVHLHGLKSAVTASALTAATRQAVMTLNTALLVTLLGALVTVAGNIAGYIRQRL
ncbi:MAG: hypothetical protein R6X29_11410 [Acidimicrobiia bacterium]